MNKIEQKKRLKKFLEVMAENDISEQRLATELGFSIDRLTNIFRGKEELSVYLYEKIAVTLMKIKSEKELQDMAQ